MSGGAGHEILARDIAMHVAAEAPEYLKPEDVPANIKGKRRRYCQESGARKACCDARERSLLVN